ncbi:MAG: prolyl oligopeptidase family serine peptidase [Thermomicrobiales bacterium]|nr:prolyl oligopeptidase family serine peptidase [Thermomicrobiales bacterium]
MRWRTLCCAILTLSILMPAAGVPVSELTFASGVSVDRIITVDGMERTYRVHVPPAAGSPGELPVLIVLHGGGGNGKQIERTTGFSDLADEEGFIAVYPDGSGRLPKRLTWNAHNCCAYAHAEHIDDVGFISELIGQLIANDPVDPARIYIAGHSNGAMMTFRLACERSDLFAAAAPYAGALNSDTCPAENPVPILIMNGEDDQNVPILGGASPHVGATVEDERIDQPASYAVDTWVAANGCVGNPVVDDSAAAMITTWTDCADDSAVEQLVIHGWEHAWPSIDDGAPIDASRVIWEFVSGYAKPRQA